MNIAILVSNRRDYPSALRLRKTLPRSAIFAPRSLELKNAAGYDKTTACLRCLFGGGRAVVAFAAGGVVIRAIAPLLRDKLKEPPVLAVVGGDVIPLLGAGSGGGWGLAKKVAAALGLRAVPATVSVGRLGIDLENPPSGWRLLNPNNFKGFVSAVLNGERANLDDAPEWLKTVGLPAAKNARLKIVQTIGKPPGTADNFADTLAYAPQRLALGVGCVRNCDPQRLYEFALECLAKYNLAPQAIGGVFTTSVKADEEAIHQLAERLAVPMRLFAPAVLQKQRVREKSEVVRMAVGSHSVSEAAALAATNGELLMAKQKCEFATIAVAAAAIPLKPRQIGERPGLLQIIGLGAGGGTDLTFKAAEAVAACEAVVGYRRYLAMASAFIGAAELHPFALGEEEQRVNCAIGLAKRGLVTGLLCSGDPGIYAMACLAFETIAAQGIRIRTKVFGGVTAMNEAAARSGAILGHDFCAISLSNLLTAEEVILKRLAAACDGDLVIALYNPTSKGRGEVYRRALRLLCGRLALTTPIVVASNLSRPAEKVRVATLKQLASMEVDMNTIVLIGNSSSRIGGGKAYTPRGYSLPQPAPRSLG